ncbi:hypothetical protein ACX93W_13985 [Paenibacillus sp. CAU 1782]
MAEMNKLTKWIEEGKQLGSTLTFADNGQTIWSSVAVQKWNGIYFTYVDEIDESKMNAEQFRREEICRFDCLNNALEHLRQTTKVMVSELAPCKGQKLFHPHLESQDE